MRQELRCIKRILYDVAHRNERIAQLQKRIDQLKDEKYNVSVTAKMNDAPGTGSVSNPTESAVIKICDLIDAQIMDLAKQIREINGQWCMVSIMIDTLPPRERRIIEMRYFQNRDWTFVSKRMKLTIRHSRRLHDAALKEFECFMENKKK